MPIAGAPRTTRSRIASPPASLSLQRHVVDLEGQHALVEQVAARRPASGSGARGRSGRNPCRRACASGRASLMALRRMLPGDGHRRAAAPQAHRQVPAAAALPPTPASSRCCTPPASRPAPPRRCRSRSTACRCSSPSCRRRSPTHARGDAPERIQRLLVKEIYLRYHVRPAGWEIEGILAVAQTAERAHAAGLAGGPAIGAARLDARAR